ncbi:MAG: energy transducer TonB [Pseudomonadota bacterium]
MTHLKSEKKSETLELRLPHSKKQAFKAACEAEGITVSHAVRTFIDAYLKRSHRMKLKQIAEDLSMTLIKNPLKSVSVATATFGLFAGTFALTAGPSQADADAQPINLPAVTYPEDMIEQGIAGTCDTLFDVTADGVVEDIVEVECSHSGFDQAVRAAIYTLQFDTAAEDGTKRPLKGVRYPFSFSFEVE